MSVREYIGARYVPLFADPLEWSSTTAYEPLTIVTHNGNSYTSRQYVPTGIDIGNTDFWALTGNYDAQIEAYRREVQTFDDRISNNETELENLNNIVEKISFSSLVDEIPAMKVANRIEYPIDYSSQGIEIYEIGGIKYYAVGFTTVDQNVDEYYIKTYRLSDNALISTTTLRDGHCNQIIRHDNKLYVITAGIPANNHTDVDVFYIQSDGSITFNQNINLANIGFTYLSSFGRYKDKWFGTTGQEFYLINDDFSAREYIGIAPRFAEAGTYQSLKYISDFDLFCYTIAFPSKLLFFNIDMQPVKTMQLKPAYNFICMNELEDFSYYSGTFYFVNNTPRIVVTNNNFKVCAVWSYEIGVDYYDMYDVSIPTGSLLFVNIDESSDGKNSINNVSPYNRNNAIVLKYASDLESFMFLPYSLDVQFNSNVNWLAVFYNVTAIIRGLEQYTSPGIFANHSNLEFSFEGKNYNPNIWLQTVNNKPVFIVAKNSSTVQTNTATDLTEIANDYYVAYIERSFGYLTERAGRFFAGKLYKANGTWSIDGSYGTGEQ